MIKQPYRSAIACYLAVPVVMFAGLRVSLFIDPELARRTANYVQNYRLLEMAAGGIRLATAGVVVLLWAATCYFLLRSKGRSLGWLALAPGGPPGFAVLAALDDRSPSDADRHQQFVQRLGRVTRVLVEVAFFVVAWTAAFASVFAFEELQVRYLSYSTGLPLATIVAERNASSGMYAFAEFGAAMYAVPLVYLFWPVCFNVVAARLRRQPRPGVA